MAFAALSIASLAKSKSHFAKILAFCKTLYILNFYRHIFYFLVFQWNAYVIP